MTDEELAAARDLRERYTPIGDSPLCDEWIAEARLALCAALDEIERLRSRDAVYNDAVGEFYADETKLRDRLATAVSARDRAERERDWLRAEVTRLNAHAARLTAIGAEASAERDAMRPVVDAATSTVRGWRMGRNFDVENEEALSNAVDFYRAVHLKAGGG